MYKLDNQHRFPDKFNNANRNKYLNMLLYYPSTKDSDEEPSEKYFHGVESEPIDIYENKNSSQVQPFHSKTQVLID